MRRLKKLLTLMTACALILQITASASLVLTKETSVDLWYRIFYSDQARLYPKDKGYENNTIWPNSNNIHGYGIISSLRPGAKSVQEVFGSDSLSLLFNEGDSVYTTGLYMKDEGRQVSFYGMTEWNGYLFCAVGGPAPNYSTESYTTDSGETTVYDTHSRMDGFYAVNGQRVYYPGYYSYDSWLYIFDLSLGTWYGDCRYAKWSIEDLGLGDDAVPRQIIENVSVDDDYIYLTLNKNVADGRDSTRSLAVFENNIDRDNPVYDDETGDIKIPERAEAAESYQDSITGAKQIVPSTRVRSTAAGAYDSALINGYLINFTAGTDISLAQSTTATKEAAIHVTDVKNMATSGIGETKTHYISSSFNKESDCSNVFISQLIPLGGGKTWNSVKDAYIRSIVPDGSSIYFLVTYTDTADSKEVYHQKLFITDWTNPLKPTLTASLDFEDEVSMYQRDNNPDVTSTVASAELYYYDGYFYSSTALGMTVIKKYDDNNELSPNIVATYDWIEDGIKPRTASSGMTLSTLYNSIPTIVSIGNCIELNYQTDQNFGSQVEMRLSTDKTKIEELAPGISRRFNPMPQIPQRDIARYGERIYIADSKPNTSFALFPSRVAVFDFSRAFPVELSLDQINAKVGAPYTITGGGMGINAVHITINDEDKGYVNVKKASGKYGTWEYTITEPGDYTIKVEGATLVGYPKEETAEVASFTVLATGELGYDADIDETTGADGLRNVIVSPKIISNTMSGYVEVMPVAAAYNGNTMIDMSYGSVTRVEKGKTHSFDDLKLIIPDNVGSYKVKVFLFDGEETISAMANYVEETF